MRPRFPFAIFLDPNPDDIIEGAGGGPDSAVGPAKKRGWSVEASCKRLASVAKTISQHVCIWFSHLAVHLSIAAHILLRKR